MTAVSSRFEITRHEKYAYSDRYAGAERMVSRFKFKTIKDTLLSCREDWTDAVLDRIDNDDARILQYTTAAEDFAAFQFRYNAAMVEIRKRWRYRHGKSRGRLRSTIKLGKTLKAKLKSAERIVNARGIGDFARKKLLLSIRPQQGRHPTTEDWERFLSENRGRYPRWRPNPERPPERDLPKPAKPKPYKEAVLTERTKAHYDSLERREQRAQELRDWAARKEAAAKQWQEDHARHWNQAMPGSLQAFQEGYALTWASINFLWPMRNSPSSSHAIRAKLRSLFLTAHDRRQAIKERTPKP